MIAHLQGQVLDIYKEKVIIDVNGVGYLVGVPGEGYLVGQSVSLFIHTAVRENEISLWGFKSMEELQMFEQLLGVTGVGLKTAQALLSSLGLRNIVLAVMEGDATKLKAPGVGSKTAERIILDMRDKVDMSKNPVPREQGGAELSESSLMAEEAIVALESLGYKRTEVENVLKRLKLSDYSQTSDLVKVILVNI
jgi:holliday junction DNA helicase RuvA